MTKLLYMEGFDIETCTAIITAIQQTEDNRIDIGLDQSCFYPRGGGQDWDTGIISKINGAVFIVQEVRLDDAGIVHHIGTISEGQFAINDTVNCVVDSGRRAINTRLHSAAHLIDMAVDALKLNLFPGKGAHYPHMSFVEYTGELDMTKVMEIAQNIETKANEFASQATDNRLKFVSIDQMHTLCRNVPANIPSNKPARVVIYGENFGVPCGGTHVSNLCQVGHITVPKIKKKDRLIKISYTVEGIN